MSAGFGYMLVSGLDIFLCVSAFPLIKSACAPANLLVLGTFSDAGFAPTFVGTTIAGSLVYVLTGKWKFN